MIDQDIALMAGRIIGSLLLIIGGIHLLAPIASMDPWRVMVVFGAVTLLASVIGTHYFFPLAALTVALLVAVIQSVL